MPIYNISVSLSITSTEGTGWANHSDVLKNSSIHMCNMHACQTCALLFCIFLRPCLITANTNLPLQRKLH